MKTKKTNRDEVRENCLNIPMTSNEKDKIRKAANEMGVSMSSFVRIALTVYLEKGGLK